MDVTKISEEIYKRILDITRKNKIEYPSIKNFVDKACLKELDRLDNK